MKTHKCPYCKKSKYVSIVDKYEPGHIHYSCEKVSYVKSGGGCGTTWRERNGKVIKSSIYKGDIK